MTENLRSAWVVWHPDSGDDGPGDGISVWARNPQRAAEKWARDYDIPEYPLSVNKNLVEIVRVQSADGISTTVHTFAVRASIHVGFHATEITP